MKVNYDFPEEINNHIKRIALDNIHGSTFLTKKSIQLIYNYVENYKFIKNDIETFKKDILIILKKIIYAQSQMASIFTFANNLMYDIDLCKRENIKNHVKNFCVKQKKYHDLNYKNILQNCTKILKEKTKIFTYSFSSTIYKTLVNFNNICPNIEVFCSESRPKNEGILLARKLGERNVSTILVTDSYLLSNIRHADIILIGADAISKKGIVNKVGSSPLIKQAFQNHIPTYVLCSSDKILPYLFKIPEEPLKPPKEIIETIMPNVNIINKYFDITAIKFFNGIVTEKGVYSPRKIRLIMKKIRIHQKLKE